jgi:hypothetical protein
MNKNPVICRKPVPSFTLKEMAEYISGLEEEVGSVRLLCKYLPTRLSAEQENTLRDKGVKIPEALALFECADQGPVRQLANAWAMLYHYAMTGELAKGKSADFIDWLGERKSY